MFRARKNYYKPLMQLVLIALLWLGSGVAARAEVVISGVDSNALDNVLAYLRLDDEPCESPAWRVRRLYSQADAEIRAAFEVVGYYNVGIDKQLEQGDSCWQASFTVTPGKPVILRNVSIIIDAGEVADEAMQAVIQACALRSGDVLQHAGYEACRSRITRVADDRGYFSKEFIERRIDVYPDGNGGDRKSVV